ncbi:hypothetical protein BDV29DRAFT_183710 [Aspergillus leporis]|jgi:hypothetical protein|uniref:Uncharacterized protein n=1 Tax=Aspergillus leporis TaxID=41062 RepID=A0A5N5WKZ0_9EURO|nr:hypothetical protein BDV29DRAFT_183710 [Aspergillus leporis]
MDGFPRDIPQRVAWTIMIILGIYPVTPRILGVVAYAERQINNKTPDSAQNCHMPAYGSLLSARLISGVTYWGLLWRFIMER